MSEDSLYLTSLLGDDDGVPDLERRVGDYDSGDEDLSISSVDISDDDYEEELDDDDSIATENKAMANMVRARNDISSAQKELDDLMCLNETMYRPRGDRWLYERLDWDSHVAKLEHEKLFENEYHMSQRAHCELLKIIGPDLRRVEYNSRSLEPIHVEHIVAYGLRVLGGGRPKDIRHFVGTSRAASYDAVTDFLNAVNSAPELSITFPSSTTEWEEEVINNLPIGLFAVADAAYTLSENLLIPYSGVDRLDPVHDTFNYYLSQLRTRVEMAFGRLVNKFRILSGKIEGSLDRVTAIITACARLYNFIIQMDGPFGSKTYDSIDAEMESLEIVANPSALLGMCYLPVVPDDMFEAYPGVSHTRDGIVDFIREQSIGRPLHNLERRRQALLENVPTANGCAVDREFVSPI
ncbi:hypothetical protein ACHAWF_006659 [Thalassiosira exigua]